MGKVKKEHKTKISKTTWDLLVKMKAKAYEEAATWQGRVLVWKENPTNLGRGELKGLVGRECVVTYTYFDSSTGDIRVRVKTRNKKGDGFIEDNDMFHRIIRPLDTFEITNKTEVLNEVF